MARFLDDPRLANEAFLRIAMLRRRRPDVPAPPLPSRETLARCEAWSVRVEGQEIRVVYADEPVPEAEEDREAGSSS